MLTPFMCYLDNPLKIKVTGDGGETGQTLKASLEQAIKRQAKTPS